MSAIASAIDSLATTGIEGYAISQGEPVSLTGATGSTVATIGSPLAGSSGTLIILGILAVVAFFIFSKHK